MNELVEISYVLGRQRFEEHLREAEALRHLRFQSDGDAPLRQQLGRTLVRLGMLLIGPHPARPANGH